MNTRALCVLSLGFCLAACRKSPENDPPQIRVDSSSIDVVGRKYPALPGLLHEAGIRILGSNIDISAYSMSDTIQSTIPDSVNLRAWDRLQEFYNKIGSRMGWKGSFTLSDRTRKIRIHFSLDTLSSFGPGLGLDDSTGYFLPPRSPEFAKGSDRIRKALSETGIHEDEAAADGSTHGVSCNAVQDINGRLYYNMSAYTYQVWDRETGEGQTVPKPPHLVDALTGERWTMGSFGLWSRKSGGKFRLLRAFPDTNPHDWHVVASNCVDDAYFWQYHPYTRTLERISLETLESAAQEKLPTGVPGKITMIREHGSPGNFNYRALSLVRDGDHFTVLRSNANTMFAQRWDPPQPEDTRYVFLSPGSDPSHFSLGDKEYGIDDIQWVDLVAPAPSRQKPAREDDFYSH